MASRGCTDMCDDLITNVKGFFGEDEGKEQSTSSTSAHRSNYARWDREKAELDITRAVIASDDYQAKKITLKDLKTRSGAAGDALKALKTAAGFDKKNPGQDFKDALGKLKALKGEVNALETELLAPENVLAAAKQGVRTGIDKLSKRNFIYAISAEIHGGVGGLWDYGPGGVALKNNIVSTWRKHFVIEEDMLEVESAMLTPYNVLKTSGHVDKFEDFMCKDLKTGACYRADKLLEEECEALLSSPDTAESRKPAIRADNANADTFTVEQLGAKLKEYGIKATDTGNDLSDPYPFNLMFGTQIGPTGKFKGYLRPETAQGIFVNFRKLLEFNNGKVPFAAAQIGHSFRNEISPRAGLIRVREFQMAEIEHFCGDDVDTVEHPKFDEVRNTMMSLLPGENQTGEDKIVYKTIGDAVKEGLVSQSTLGYYLARTHLFMMKIGINPAKLRFRQHKADEMAHYARDCWDAEIYCSYGWVECVGHADRACFDLNAHATATKTNLSARKVYKEKKKVTLAKVKVNGRVFKKLGKAGKPLMMHLRTLKDEDAFALADQLKNGPVTINICSGEYEVTPEMFSVKKQTKMVGGHDFVPSVVEPSFGIGRILYCLLEHSYWKRPQDAQRVVLSLRPSLANVKVSVFAQSNKDDLKPLTSRIHRELKKRGVASRTDDSGVSIGRKYARADEAGQPFAVTVDFDSLKDNCITIRERDSEKQIRIPFGEAAEVLQGLATEGLTWAEVFAKYPEQVRPSAES